MTVETVEQGREDPVRQRAERLLRQLDGYINKKGVDAGLDAGIVNPWGEETLGKMKLVRMFVLMLLTDHPEEQIHEISSFFGFTRVTLKFDVSDSGSAGMIEGETN